MNKKIFIRKWTVPILLSFLFEFCELKECVHRIYNASSSVCVCNTTYCDTVEPVHLPVPGKYVAYTSSKDGLRFSKSHGIFTAHYLKNTDILVSININETYQTIYGWGGAFTDAAGVNIVSLNKKARKHLLRSYFSKTGIQYSMCRVPIGETDLSTRYYSYDDVEDFNLTHFKLVEEDYKYKIPFIKEALRMSNRTLKLFAAPWSSPLWMTTNGKRTGFLKRNYYQTWADYYVKFLDAYSNYGIKFWGITTGNEPVNILFPFITISTVGWLPWNQGKWIAENLGPTIRNSKYADTKIIALDDEQSLTVIWLVLATLFNKAEQYIDGIGIHWYMNTYFSSPLQLAHFVFPDKFILNTEATAGDMRFLKKVSLGSWERAELYADDIIADMNEWVSGWIEWNLALDLNGGPSYLNNFVDASIIVNATAQEFYKQPTYYVLGHFSKYVPPSSVKVSSSCETESIQTVAFHRPDNGTSIVVYNKNDYNVRITIHDPRRGYLNFKAFNRSISTIVYS